MGSPRVRTVTFEERPAEGIKDGGDVLALDDNLELAAMAAAKACVQAAIQELTLSIGKVEGSLSSAIEILSKTLAPLEGGDTHPGNARGIPASPVVDAPSKSSETRPQPDANRQAAPLDDDLSDLPPPGLKERQTSAESKTSKASDIESLASLTPAAMFGSDAAVQQQKSMQQHVVGTRSTSSSLSVNAETLPDTWPTSLEIRWSALNSDACLASHAKKGFGRRRSSLSNFSLSEHMLVPHKAWFVMLPASRGRMAYDIFSAALLAFDLIVIPWAVAWDIPPAGSLYYMAWATAFFWTADIGVNTITAFYDGDACVVEPLAITKHYLKSWFVPDLTIVLGDWVSIIALSSPGLRTLRLAKVGRLLRLVALVRLLKLTRIMSEFVEERLSNLSQLMYRFAKMVFATLAYAHVIGCVWFLIGRGAPTDTGARWLDSLPEENVAYQYVTCFHWAMAQITLGAIEIPSGSLIERLYSILCLLMGLLFGSTLVSTLSATMLEAQMDKRESQEKLRLTKRYLRQNNVYGILATRVERQLVERMNVKDKILEEQVEGLQLLSSSLRSELRFNLMVPYLKCHSLFHFWVWVDTRFVAHFCRKCMAFVHLRTQDDLFAAGKVADSAYFFSKGGMTYTQEPESSPVSSTRSQTVEEGCWMAEAAVWSQWIHVGTACATCYSDATKVIVADVMEVMVRTTTVFQTTIEYCRKFHQRLQSAKPPALPWPDDLQVPQTEWSDILPSLDVDTQIAIGLETIRQAEQAELRRSWVKTPPHWQKLTEEVKKGKSTVMINSEGDVERVVSVVALQILDSEGRMFVQVGKQEASNKLRPACQLPGGKPEPGELAMDATNRFLATKMAPLVDHVEFQACDREAHWEPSAEFGVRTKYLRCVVVMRLASPPGGDSVALPEVDWERLDGKFGRPVMRIASGGSMQSSRLSNYSNDAASVREVLNQRSLFCIQDDKGGRGLYAWLSQQEFDALKGLAGMSLLPEWEAWLDANSEQAVHCGDERSPRACTPNPAASRSLPLAMSIGPWGGDGHSGSALGSGVGNSSDVLQDFQAHPRN